MTVIGLNFWLMTENKFANSIKRNEEIVNILNLWAKTAFAMIEMIEIKSKMTEKLRCNSDPGLKFVS